MRDERIESDGIPVTMAEAADIVTSAYPHEDWRAVSYLALPGRWGTLHARRGPIGGGPDAEDAFFRFGGDDGQDFR